MSRELLTRRLVWALALASLGFGIWRSLQPTALPDFQSVMFWTNQVAQGESPWAGVSEADYPPWAIAVLLPWLIIPEALRAPAWVVANVGLAVLLVRSLVRAVPMPAGVALTLTGLLLATGPFRVLSQFSVLSFALAWAGVRDSSPGRGGVWLGLGLMKPQIAGPLWLAHLLMRDWRRVTVAAVVPMALMAAVALWLGMTPGTLLTDYLSAVSLAQAGVLPGHTELRQWLMPWLGSWPVLPATGLIAGVLVVPVLLITARPSLDIWAQPRRRLEVYALCGVVSLLAVRHLSYDFLLFLPVLVAWSWSPGAAAGTGVPRPAWWFLTGWLVLQPLSWIRRLGGADQPWAQIDWLLELDRLLCMALFGLLLWRFMRLDITE
jgi:hypothetical protein